MKEYTRMNGETLLATVRDLSMIKNKGSNKHIKLGNWSKKAEEIA